MKDDSLQVIYSEPQVRTELLQHLPNIKLSNESPIALIIITATVSIFTRNGRIGSPSANVFCFSSNNPK